MDEVLVTEQVIGIPFYIKVWLIMELSKEDNRIAIKNKYKRIFKETLPEFIINEVFKEHYEDIQNLKRFIKNDLDSHEMSNPYNRMDNYKRIAGLAEEGVLAGADVLGNPVFKVDLNAALKANELAQKEIQQSITNELKLLEIMIKTDKFNPVQGLGNNTPVIAQDHLNETIEGEARQITTDTDKYFKDEGGDSKP